MELRQSCESMQEIANKIGCTVALVYNYIIPEVLKQNPQVTRDQLLYKPNKKHVFTMKPGRPFKSKNPLEASNSEETAIVTEEEAEAKEKSEVEDIASEIEEASSSTKEVDVCAEYETKSETATNVNSKGKQDHDNQLEEEFTMDMVEKLKADYSAIFAKIKEIMKNYGGN